MAKKATPAKPKEPEITTSPVKFSEPFEGTIKTVGMYKATKGWKFVEIEIEGDAVVSRKESDPNARGVILNKFKLAFVRTFMKGMK